MADTKINFSGFVVKSLNEYSDSIRKSIEKLIDDTAKEIVANIKATGPRSTRNTEHMVDTFTSMLKVDANQITATVYSKQKSHIAHFVEYGTVNMPPQPFLRPTYDKYIPAFEIKLKKIIEKG